MWINLTKNSIILYIQLFFDELEIVEGISLLFDESCDVEFFFDAVSAFVDDLELLLLLFGETSTAF